MAADRLSVTVDSELGREVRAAARRCGVSVSSWVAQAIEVGLRNEYLRKALDAWQAEQGPFTGEELAEADRILDEAKQGSAALAAGLAVSAPTQLR